LADDGSIRTGDARKGLITESWLLEEQEGVDDGVEVLQPVPDITDVTCEHFILNRSGTAGVIAGSSSRDPDIIRVLVVDITDRSGSSGKEVPVIDVDRQFFDMHPGLQVLDVMWHPDSEHHIGVLTSDSVIRIYNLNEPALPEQIFELKRGKIGLSIHEDDSWNEPVPVSFRFGQGEGWNTFSIFVLMSNGDLRTLCPIAPFGVQYSSRFLKRLVCKVPGMEERLKLLSKENAEITNALDEVEEDGLNDLREEECTWLSKAFDLESQGFSRPVLYSAPHGMGSKTPLLSNPIQIRSNKKEEDKSDDAFPACGFLTWQIGASLTGVVLASSDGTIRAGVITSQVEPQWTMNPPQYILRGSDIVAVRSQCCPSISLSQKQGDSDTSFVLIDEVSLPSGKRNASAPDLGTEWVRSRDTIGLALDPSLDMTVVVFQQHYIHSITLPWIPILKDYVLATEAQILSSKVDQAEELPDVLPFPFVEEIKHVEFKNSPIISFSIIGDKLSGAAIVTLQSNGTFDIKRIQCGKASISRALEDEIDSVSTLEQTHDEKLSEFINSIYGPILKLPRKAKTFKFDFAKPMESPENYRALIDSIQELRSTHIEFGHRVNHIVHERLAYLKDELQDQLSTMKRLKSMQLELERGKEKIENRKEELVWMSNNIDDRVKLLAELHWAIPCPLSKAEKEFKSTELPLLESNSVSLAQEVSTLQLQATRLRTSGIQQSISSMDDQSHSLPPGEMRRIREKLTENDESIRECCRKLDIIDKAIQETL
jgi:nuclear pore complex protein Nup88